MRPVRTCLALATVLAYNGLIIGPDNRFNLAVADVLDRRWVRPWLGWAQPKLFMVFRKPDQFFRATHAATRHPPARA